MNICSSQQQILGSGSQYVLECLKRRKAENPEFFYEIEGDGNVFGDGGNVNVFWADANSRTNYTYFGDTVRIDALYRTNQTNIPFVTFSGINHHAQPILFGCALLLNETDDTFTWLFRTWLKAMYGNAPISITTYPDQHVQMASALVLPQTRHRFCRWGILRQTSEKLANLYQNNQGFDFELKKCVNDADTVEEFESCWASLMDRYYLIDNEWLQYLYRIRNQWVPVYMKDVFFGDLVADCDGVISSFVEGFFSSVTNIQLLIEQYENALASCNERESKDDFDTYNMTPVLKTPSPMEKQAANLYTGRVFLKFQEELVETLANSATAIDGSSTTFRVAKFGEEHKAHLVRYDTLEAKASCSCRMFEFSGVICRHILSVFRANNVVTLPLEYVLKRWTRDAKRSANGCPTSDVYWLPSENVETSSVRRNKLQEEAIKFVEDGSKSVHVYNTAMDALHEASKRVVAFNNRATQVSKEGNLRRVRTVNHSSSSLSREEKENKIHELTAELNRTNQKTEVYRAILLALLKDMEDQKLKLSVKVENARLSLRE